eukprot:PhF_6_TR37191/c0_g1_i1/m.54799
MIVPFHPTYIFDPWRFLESKVYHRLHKELISLHSRHNIPVVVVILRSIHDHRAEATAKLAEVWHRTLGIGNDGVIVFLSLAERTVRVQHGVHLPLSRYKDVVQAVTNRMKRGGTVQQGIEAGMSYIKHILNPWPWRIKLLAMFAILGLGIAWWVRRRKQAEQRMNVYRAAIERANALKVQNNPTVQGTCGICIGSLLQPSEFYSLSTSSSKSTVVVTRCKHPFHLVCLEQWLERSDMCPLCRQETPIENRTPNAVDAITVTDPAVVRSLEWETPLVDNTTDFMLDILDVRYQVNALSRANYSDSSSGESSFRPFYVVELLGSTQQSNDERESWSTTGTESTW